jgi:hypothetical protein
MGTIGARPLCKEELADIFYVVQIELLIGVNERSWKKQGFDHSYPQRPPPATDPTEDRPAAAATARNRVPRTAADHRPRWCKRHGKSSATGLLLRLDHKSLDRELHMSMPANVAIIFTLLLALAITRRTVCRAWQGRAVSHLKPGRFSDIIGC